MENSTIDDNNKQNWQLNLKKVKGKWHELSTETIKKYIK